MPAPIITVQDNANGTGAGVFITGSPGGSVNTIEATLADRTAWAPTGAVLSGDGSITAPVQAATGGPGINLTSAWQIRANNNIAGYSNAVTVLPTLGLDSPIFKAIVAAQGMLLGANIDGIGGRVYRCEHPLPFATQVQMWPAILIHPLDPEQRIPATNRQTKWALPLVVGVADADCDYYSRMETHLYARMQAMDTFDRKPLKFASTNWTGNKATVEPKNVVEPESPEYQFFYSTFILKVDVYRVIAGGN